MRSMVNIKGVRESPVRALGIELINLERAAEAVPKERAQERARAYDALISKALAIHDMAHNRDTRIGMLARAVDLLRDAQTDPDRRNELEGKLSRMVAQSELTKLQREERGLRGRREFGEMMLKISGGLEVGPSLSIERLVDIAYTRALIGMDSLLVSSQMYPMLMWGNYVVPEVYLSFIMMPVKLPQVEFMRGDELEELVFCVHRSLISRAERNDELGGAIGLRHEMPGPTLLDTPIEDHMVTLVHGGTLVGISSFGHMDIYITDVDPEILAPAANAVARIGDDVRLQLLRMIGSGRIFQGISFV